MSCKISNYNVLDHFANISKMVQTGDSIRNIKDYKLSRYACYLIAKNAGVKNFDKFHNYGYKGLYNDETANEIAKRKGLRYHEDILDNMCSEELVDNLFRIVQTEAKLKNSDIKDEKDS